MTIWRKNTAAALRGIALSLLLASGARAQAGSGGDDGAPEAEDAACMPNRQPHECPDRCPSYDTCLVADEGRLYYSVGDQRFDCDELDCRAASETLSDYCCRRGEFEPSHDDGGCALQTGPAPARFGGVGLALGCLAVASLWRRRRHAAPGGHERG